MKMCTDEELGRLLYAYELGMLSGEERERFEIHLLECKACNDEVVQFAKASDLLRDDSNLKQYVLDVWQEKVERVSGQESIREVPSKRIRSRKLVPILAAVTIILLALVLKDWTVEFRPSREVLAVENRIAVVGFNNLSDPDDSGRLGEIIRSLLITNLSEAKSLQVVSGQRLHDILRFLRKRDKDILNRDVAAEVAREARARWMLTGDIFRDGKNLAAAAQLIEVSTGTVVSSVRTSASADAGFFALADSLTAAVGRFLPSRTAPEFATHISAADATTRSPEAYFHYVEGVDFVRKYYIREAVSSFERALEYDSTFAQAYYFLSVLKDTSLIAKAVQYMESVGELEKHYIRSLAAVSRNDIPAAIAELETMVERFPEEKDAHYALATARLSMNQPEAALYHFREVIRLDPLHKLAFNQLAYLFDSMGQVDSAVVALDQYVSLAPDEANPYDSRGEILMRHGRLDDAIGSFQKALSIKPDFLVSLQNLGIAYLFRQDYSDAEKCFRDYMSLAGPVGRSSARLHLAYILVHQGRLHEALTALDNGIAEDREDMRKPTAVESYAAKHLLKSIIYAHGERFDLAVKQFDSYLDQYREEFPEAVAYYYPNLHVWLLAENGETERATEIAEKTRQTLESINGSLHTYSWMIGYIQRAQSDLESSIGSFGKALSGYSDFDLKYTQARTLVQAGSLTSAIEILESLTSYYTKTRAFWGTSSVEIHYYLGLAYEQSGDEDNAAAQYQTFLELWKDADPDIQSVITAKERLRYLRSPS